jgi:hypothetical protein
MPHERTDLQPELSGFVRALKYHASLARQSASQNKGAERLRSFADYLDAKAAALEAAPRRIPVAQVQSGPLEPQIGVA